MPRESINLSYFHNESTSIITKQIKEKNSRMKLWTVVEMKIELILSVLWDIKRERMIEGDIGGTLTLLNIESTKSASFIELFVLLRC